MCAKVLTATFTLRSQRSELLLDDAPGVGGSLSGVETGLLLELLNVDLRRGFEAGPGSLEDALLLLGEDDVGLGRAGLLGGRGRHDCWWVGVWAFGC